MFKFNPQAWFKRNQDNQDNQDAPAPGTHMAMLYTSPGRMASGRPRPWIVKPEQKGKIRRALEHLGVRFTQHGPPTPALATITTRDHAQYMVFSDGSFRLRPTGGLPRRPKGFSGRQRRKLRKMVQRRFRAPQVAA